MTTVEVSLDEVVGRISQSLAEALASGHGWWFVRVWPDGGVTSGQEVSRCVPEAEYYRHGRPHPVTVWSFAPAGEALSDVEIGAEVDAGLDAIEVAEVARLLTEAGYDVI